MLQTDYISVMVTKRPAHISVIYMSTLPLNTATEIMARVHDYRYGFLWDMVAYPCQLQNGVRYACVPNQYYKS